MILLPIAFAGTGLGYYAFESFRKPDLRDAQAMVLWEKHMKGARFAAVAGVGAGLLLWLLTQDSEESVPESLPPSWRASSVASARSANSE
jgi:hypothetical protein